MKYLSIECDKCGQAIHQDKDTEVLTNRYSFFANSQAKQFNIYFDLCNPCTEVEKEKVFGKEQQVFRQLKP